MLKAGCLGLLFVGLLTWLFPTAGRAQEAPATLSDWTSTTPISGSRTSHTAFVAHNRLYVLGGLRASGNNITLYDDVQVAELGNDGAVLPSGWQKIRSLPSARSGHGSIVVDDRVYLVGGYSAAGTLGDVYVAPIEKNGQIGPWVQSSSHLNIPRSNFSLEAWKSSSGTTFLLAIGGVDQVGPDTVHFDEVEAAPIAADGSVGGWKICSFHLKGGRSAPATAVVSNTLIVLGGWGDRLDDVFGDIQSAALREDGCPDPWSTSARGLTLPVYGHAAVPVSVDGSMVFFVLGGNAGQGNYLNTVQAGLLSKEGAFDKFGFDKHLFTIPRWGFATARYADFIYVVGGAQRGGDGYLSDVQFSSVSAP